MKLLVDENIPGAREAFGQFGEVRLMPGRAIDARAVRDIDVLLVRSVTRVDAALLDGSAVRFVGSTTAGIDHVDADALTARGIRFAHAPGSNADSVVDYVMSALAIAFPDAAALAGRRIGIVGCGQVGGRLLRRLRALDVACLPCDPFLSDADLPGRVTLDEALDCDVLSLHVPLTRDGAHPTHHLLDAARLRALRPDALLINTSRGSVVDNAALLALLAEHPRQRAVLDVWEGEPRIDAALLARVLVGTPHIAGYALDGKLRGVAQVYAALREFLGAGDAPERIAALSPAAAGTLRIAAQPQDSCWQRAALSCYDPREDGAPLRATAEAGGNVAHTFDALRRAYPPRREFGAWHLDTALAGNATLRAAGFTA